MTLLCYTSILSVPFLQRTLPSTDLGTEEWGHCSHKPDHVNLRSLWKSLGLWAREALECCKQSLIGHSEGSLGDENAKRNAGSGGPRSEGLTGEQKFFQELGHLGHSCYILAKNLASLCLCPENLNEAEVKSK